MNRFSNFSSNICLFMDILFNVITDDVKLMWHNFENKDSLERSVLIFCRSRTFTEVVVWFIKLQVWKLIIKKKGQKCRKAYYVLLQTLDGLFLEVDKVAVFFLSVIKLQMGKFLIKKKKAKRVIIQKANIKVHKEKKPWFWAWLHTGGHRSHQHGGELDHRRVAELVTLAADGRVAHRGGVEL